jgi:hypothetical protein
MFDLSFEEERLLHGQIANHASISLPIFVTPIGSYLLTGVRPIRSNGASVRYFQLAFHGSSLKVPICVELYLLATVTS